jgi:hypothetical protein
MRRTNDFYETPPWQTRALLHHQPIYGSILEPCVGDGSIARVLRQGMTITNDIDPARPAHYHFSAADPKLYEAIGRDYGSVDWVITNPPYAMPLCRDIVALAVQHATIGVAMLLRISFREPTAKINPRGPFLVANPPHRLLTLPRHSYIGNGKSDSATTEWVVWLKQPWRFRDFAPIQSLYNADVNFSDRDELPRSADAVDPVGERVTG